jgi:hypothetical protein
MYVATYTVIEPPKKPFCRREKRRTAANFVANASYWKTDRRLERLRAYSCSGQAVKYKPFKTEGVGSNLGSCHNFFFDRAS